MKYLLRRAVLGKVPEIEISKEKYEEYQSARKVLSNCLAIEEKYEILLSNYLEFEKQILDTTMSYMVREHLDYSDFFDVRLGLNIRLVNLLTAARLYVDQLSQNVRECVPELIDSDRKVRDLFSNEYDRKKEYRFMEALRNYVQHRGIPVQWASFKANRVFMNTKQKPEGESDYFEYSMEIASLRSYLEEDDKFKREVLKELGEKIDLITAVRNYMEAISNVHDSVRRIIEQSVDTSRALFEEAHQQYATINNGESSGNLTGLSACIWSEDREIDSVPLLLDWDNVRIKLQKRNKKLINLSKRYVTGKN